MSKGVLLGADFYHQFKVREIMHWIDCFVFSQVRQVDFTKWQNVVWPFACCWAIAAHRAHTRVIFKRLKLGFNFLESHEIHYGVTASDFFFLDSFLGSLRLFRLFAI